MREIVGAASAGVLGFITNNMRGAKRAASAYLTYSKSKKQKMAPTGRSRSRGRPTTRSPPTLYTPQSNRTRQTINPSRSRSVASQSRSVSMRRVSFSNAGSNASSRSNGSELVAKASRKKGKKVAREGIKKKLKVPTRLRKQIQQVVSTKGKAIGRMTEIKYFTVTPSDSQVIRMLGNITDGNPNLFDPVYIQYVASCLFNGATVTQTPLNSTARFFSPKTLSVDVLKQNVIYRMVNNTQRTLTIKIWDLSPKSRNFNTGFNPYVFWQNSLIADATAPNNPNKFSITPETLYSHPKMTEKFRNLYTVDETIVNLEAGKEFVHKLEGPNKTYNFQKFWDEGIFATQQKFIKHTMICVYVDLTNTTLATPGRFTDIAAGDPYDLVIEQTTFTKIAMPEQAGFTLPTPAPVAGDFVPLNQRYSTYAIQNWAGAQAGAASKVEDNNPIQPASGAGI